VRIQRCAATVCSNALSEVRLPANKTRPEQEILMRLFLLFLFTISLTPVTKAASCSGTGYLQNMPVYVWNVQFYSCKAQGLICFESEAANEGFHQKIAMTFRFQGKQNFLVVGDNFFVADRSRGSMEYDLETGYRRVYIEDQQKTRLIDFTFNCVPERKDREIPRNRGKSQSKWF